MHDQLGPVIYMKDTDYEYRAYCTRAAWARAMADMSLDIDYTKFKPTTETKYRDFQLHRLYNEMWSVIQHHLSSRERRYEYWHPRRTRKNKKRDARVLTTTDFQQLLRDEDFDNEWSLFDNEVFKDVDTSDVDALTEGPDMRPDGSLDHSTCDHAPSNAARKRCRRRWAKNHK